MADETSRAKDGAEQASTPDAPAPTSEALKAANAAYEKATATLAECRQAEKAALQAQAQALDTLAVVRLRYLAEAEGGT